MKINRRFSWKETLDSKIVNNKLVSPNPGVAYVVGTDKVYFNNVVLDENEPGPAALDTREITA